MLSSYGIPQHEIAKLLRVAPHTLRKHYHAELRRGGIRATMRVAESLFRAATAGEGHAALVACIFWLKCRAGWREFDRGDGGEFMP